MQIINRGNWPERSLSYLCRNYDSLEKGEDYKNVNNAIHIGFIDFTLFPDEPEFCSTYMMFNIKTHRIYTSKFMLKVAELNHPDIAIIVRNLQSKLRACLHAIAQRFQCVQSNEEEAVRDMCRARREAVAFEEYMKEEKERLLLENEKLEAEIAMLKEELELLKTVKNN